MRIRYLNPIVVFFTVVTILYFVPSLFIHSFSLKSYGVEFTAHVADLYFLVNIVSFAAIISAITVFIIIGGSLNLKPIVSMGNSFEINYKVFNLIMTLLLLIAIISSIPFLWVVSIPKVLALGTDIDGHTFRLLGYDDVSKSITFLFEINRRILFPAIVVTGLVFLSEIQYKILFYFGTLVFFVSAFSTFDRAPALIFIITICLGSFLTTNKIKFYWFKLMLIILLAAFIGAIINALQYNNTEIAFNEMVGQAWRLLYSRVLFDPAYMSLEYNFNRYADLKPFFLEHSRLGYLIGRGYVGSAEVSSQFITPVGFVSDIWRNFGLSGVFIFSYLLSTLFIFFSCQISKLNPVCRPAFSMLIIVLSALLVYGVLFSLGTFSVIGALFAIIYLSRFRLYKK